MYFKLTDIRDNAKLITWIKPWRFSEDIGSHIFFNRTGHLNSLPKAIFGKYQACSHS